MTKRAKIKSNSRKTAENVKKSNTEQQAVSKGSKWQPQRSPEKVRVVVEGTGLQAV